MIPQLIYIALCLIGLGMTFAKHGEPKTDKNDGWVSLISTIAIWTLLYYGGFFNVLLH